MNLAERDLEVAAVHIVGAELHGWLGAVFEDVAGDGEEVAGVGVEGQDLGIGGEMLDAEDGQEHAGPCVGERRFFQ